VRLVRAGAPLARHGLGLTRIDSAARAGAAENKGKKLAADERHFLANFTANVHFLLSKQLSTGY
jgi:hypothetical protein